MNPRNNRIHIHERLSRRSLRQVSTVVGLSTAILAWRFFQIRDLALPAWVDSVQHALLVRLLLEGKQIPQTWAPYWPQIPFYYHFGFHITAASFALLTNLDVGKSVLIVGQLWQGLLVIGVYVLAITLFGRHQIGIVAVILVGFVSQMPAYYVAWGRYSLLAGITLMIFAMAAALRRKTLILAFLVATTAITYYYALILLISFLVILVAVSQEHRCRVIIGTVTGLALTSFWLLRTLELGARHLRIQVGATQADYDPGYLWYFLGPTRNYILLAIALVGGIAAAISLNRRGSLNRPGVFAFVGWTAVLLALMGPWRVLPFRPDHAAIVVFVPTVLLAAYALCLLERPVVVVSLLIAFVAWGAWETWSPVRSDTIVAGSEDVEAMKWIDRETLSSAVFLIDVTMWGSGWRGTDGGWWITPLTGRRTVLPPAMYLFGERAVIQAIHRLADETLELERSQQSDYCANLQLLVQHSQANYYYTRSMRPALCPNVTSVYSRGHSVRIYDLRQVVGGPTFSPR